MDHPEHWALCYETNNYSPTLHDLFANREFSYPTLLEQLEAAANAGYALVGLDLGNVDNYLATGRDLADLRAELRRLNLRCLEVANLTIDASDGTRRSAEHCFEVARALDASFIQCSVFGDLQSAGAIARELESMLVGDTVRLALEFLPFSPLNSIRGTQQFIQTHGLKNTQIVLDTWHLFFGPDPWEQLDAITCDEIAYVQFNDHARRQSEDLLLETVNYRLLPGVGHFDLKRFCSTLKQRGYRGAISVEVLSAALRTWSPDRFALAEYRATRQFWP